VADALETSDQVARRQPMVMHLNGPPGVGKSTLARRWAREHPGTLLLEIDDLRTWVSGWRTDFEAVGARVRPLALAMIEAYARTGYDVVVPQLVAGADELAKFRRAATDAGATSVVVFLEAEPHELAARLAGRPMNQPSSEAVRRLIEEAGSGHVEGYRQRLLELSAGVPEAIRLPTRTDEVDGAYEALLARVHALLR
jgi:predicted kinase